MRLPVTLGSLLMSCGRLWALGNTLATNSILPRDSCKRLFLIDYTAPQRRPNRTAAASGGTEGSMSIEHFR